VKFHRTAHKYGRDIDTDVIIPARLPIMESPEALDGISDGDEVEIDADASIIVNVTTGETYRAQPFPPFVKDIIEKGGLIEAVKEKISVNQEIALVAVHLSHR